jgi:hypothetical protein
MGVDGAEGRGQRIKKMSEKALAELEQEQDRQLKRAAAAWKARVASTAAMADAESKGIPFPVFKAEISRAEIAREELERVGLGTTLAALKRAYARVEGEFEGIHERFLSAERSGLPFRTFMEEEAGRVGVTPVQFFRIFAEISMKRSNSDEVEVWGGEEGADAGGDVSELIDLMNRMGGRRRRRHTRRRRGKQVRRRKTQRNPKRKRA